MSERPRERDREAPIDFIEGRGVALGLRVKVACSGIGQGGPSSEANRAKLEHDKDNGATAEAIEYLSKGQ